MKIPELEYPQVTDDFRYILEHFWALKSRKGVRLSYLELQAYNDLTSSNLSSFEVDLIMKIDSIFEEQNYD